MPSTYPSPCLERCQLQLVAVVAWRRCGALQGRRAWRVMQGKDDAWGGIIYNHPDSFPGRIVSVERSYHWDKWSMICCYNYINRSANILTGGSSAVYTFPAFLVVWSRLGVVPISRVKRELNWSRLLVFEDLGGVRIFACVMGCCLLVWRWRAVTSEGRSGGSHETWVIIFVLPGSSEQIRHQRCMIQHHRWQAGKRERERERVRRLNGQCTTGCLRDGAGILILWRLGIILDER